jgi:AraC-like DNA-binding protein
MKQSYFEWHYQAVTDHTGFVLPDGCRDLLVIHRDAAPNQVVLTDWDIAPRAVNISRGTRMTGYRLRPGTEVTPALTQILAAGADPAEILAECPTDTAWPDLIAELSAPDANLSRIAKNSGLSLRSLQRQFKRQDLPAPEFWRLLGRARRAEVALRGTDSLAHIALDLGYADQALFARDMRRWFGHSPRALRQNHLLLAQMSEPALGNWTAEHSSTK